MSIPQEDEMSKRKQESLPSSLIDEDFKQMKKENAELKQYVLALQGEVYGARLAAKYLDKELAGRWNSRLPIEHYWVWKIMHVCPVGSFTCRYVMPTEFNRSNCWVGTWRAPNTTNSGLSSKQKYIFIGIKQWYAHVGDAPRRVTLSRCPQISWVFWTRRWLFS